MVPTGGSQKALDPISKIECTTQWLVFLGMMLMHTHNGPTKGSRLRPSGNTLHVGITNMQKSFLGAMNWFPAENIDAMYGKVNSLMKTKQRMAIAGLLRLNHFKGTTTNSII